MSSDATYTITALLAVKDAELVTPCKTGTKVSTLSNLGAGVQWKETSYEVTLHASDIRSINPLAENSGGIPLEPIEAKSGRISVVPANARTVIILESGERLFISTGIDEVFNSDSERSRINIVGLMFAASDRVHPELPITIPRSNFGALRR